MSPLNALPYNWKHIHKWNPKYRCSKRKEKKSINLYHINSCHAERSISGRWKLSYTTKLFLTALFDCMTRLQRTIFASFTWSKSFLQADSNNKMQSTQGNFNFNLKKIHKHWGKPWNILLSHRSPIRGNIKILQLASFSHRWIFLNIVTGLLTSISKTLAIRDLLSNEYVYL